ncbi:MAG: YabP/YqfC family sporulation protein [Clostridia bacterium]|nr:YabP/YqfC family sporulation protein [Clostridia bacterium]
MSFIEEVIQVFGGEDIAPAYKVMLIGESAAYIEGVKAIKSYSQGQIELFMKKGEMKITGEGLFIKKYCAGDLAVCGKIKALEKI